MTDLTCLPCDEHLVAKGHTVIGIATLTAFAETRDLTMNLKHGELHVTAWEAIRLAETAIVRRTSIEIGAICD